MSAYLMVEKASSIEIVTDGAAWTHDSIVRKIGSKVDEIADMPAVFLGRGAAWPMTLFVDVAHEKCARFDDVVDRFQEMAAVAVRQSIADIGEESTNRWQMLMAGWSDKQARLAAYTYSLDKDRFRPVAFVVWSGPDRHWPFFAMNLMLPEQRERFDAEREGCLALEWMRREPNTFQDSKHPQPTTGYGVGGFIEHVSLTRQRIDRRIIRVWPDEIGRPVDPFTEERVH